MRNTFTTTPNGLTQALQTALLCAFILLVLAVASLWDNDAERQLASQMRTAADESACLDKGRQIGRAELVDTVRDAWRQGLQEGAERERANATRRVARVQP